MTIDTFRSTLSSTQPPDGISESLKALWYDAKGDWDKAHTIAQEIATRDGSWVHAYLHRKEGDQGNAAYWYQRAGKAVSRLSLAEEWGSIVKDLLARNH